jgi:hypothetical protein
LQVRRIGLAPHPLGDARSDAGQDIVRDLQQQAQPCLVGGFRLVDRLAASIAEQENLAGRRSRSPTLVLIAATSRCSRAAVASSEMMFCSLLRTAQSWPI